MYYSNDAMVLQIKVNKRFSIFRHDNIYHHDIDVDLAEEDHGIEDSDDELEATVLSSKGKREGHSHNRGCQGQETSTVPDMSSSFAK